MILITRAFRKEMKSFSWAILDEILSLLRKHSRWLDTNLFRIQDFGHYFVLKGYLEGKSVRIIVAKWKEQHLYIPLALYKKESKLWFNIREDFDVRWHMDRMEKCIQNNEFETFDIM